MKKLNSGKPVKPRITDVARKAGVSISTVSRVLRDSSPVAEDKKRKVLETVREIHYTPNFMASKMKDNSVNQIGVILPNLVNTVIMRIAEVILSENKTRGYETLFACSENDKNKELAILDLFRSSLVDAVICASVLTDSRVFRNMEAVGIPVVLFDRIVGDIDWIGENSYQASYDLTKFVIEKGHRKIAFIKGVGGTSISNNRYDGYLQAMKNVGISPISEFQLQGDFREDLAFAAVMDLFNKKDKQDYPTAIISANTDMMVGATNAILEQGLKIPDDISIACYGDPEFPLSLRPHLTFVRQNHVEIGKQLSERVSYKLENIDEIGGEKIISPYHVLVPTSFVEGETVRNLNP